MIKRVIYFAFFFATNIVFGQQLDIASQIDSLIATKTEKPFNGIIVISQNGETKYSKIFGYSNFENKTPLKENDQFVIGSISKQITAVVVLQEFEKGHIKLDVAIRNYLPELTMTWADTITIHQLLTHTHGIKKLDKPLAFIAGTQFAYSQIGYDLLATIVERTSKRSFADLSTELFEKCKMKNTFHPDLHKHLNLVNGYAEQEDGSIIIEKGSLENYAAAGSFVSDASDLILWDENLFGGKLLLKSTFQLMTTKQKYATREHPIFGKIDYGYGITIDSKDSILQYGQTGFAPGFVSMNFYFPASKTSVVVLENIAWDFNDLKKTFYFQIQILKIVRENKLIKKNYR
ncbi:MAG: serine hydrolase domain-containing protein [Bacteroidota bacterium]